MSARAKILVVDDSATSRGAMLAILCPDYEVHSASDGLEGVARANVVRPDLILMDVNMPVLDGRAACRALRADPVNQGTPVILVTALDAEDDVELGYRCGANDYVCKPVDEAELRAKVASCVNARRAGT